MNIVLDTNVLVSGLFFNGPPSRILTAWHSGQFILFASSEILDEYSRVIRELSHKKSTFNPDTAIAYMQRKIHTIKSEPLPSQICDDPHDDKFIACALTIKAIIITGDKALLKTAGYKQLAVLSPAEFERKYII